MPKQWVSRKTRNPFAFRGAPKPAVFWRMALKNTHSKKEGYRNKNWFRKIRPDLHLQIYACISAVLTASTASIVPTFLSAWRSWIPSKLSGSFESNRWNALRSRRSRKGRTRTDRGWTRISSIFFGLSSGSELSEIRMRQDRWSVKLSRENIRNGHWPEEGKGTISEDDCF